MSAVTVSPEGPHVAIVGGGFGGIAAGVYLKKAGLHDFTIYEQSTGIGGTWWDNRYPGAEVDVSSHLYSYSFMTYDWSRTHARQGELQRYLEAVVDHFDLRRHFVLGTRVERIVWNASDDGYDVHLGGGTIDTARAVISAVGLLNVPRYPEWPGLDDFDGPAFHTARWEDAHDLRGKTVAVVGTGSTASQVVPALADIAGRITLFQREPGWVIPKGDRDFTDEERTGLAGRAAHRRERRRLFWQYERGQILGAIHRPGTKVNALRERQCRGYIAYVFKERPDLAEAVTPTYPYPGKRPVLTGQFYPALLRDNVNLVPHAVVSVTPRSLVDARGVEHPADVLVMATGFQPANYLASFDVVGPGGRSVREFWAGEPKAFLGITVPGFPNFFMLYGPNTNGGEIVSLLERQARFAARSIKTLRSKRVDSVEVRPSFYARYNRWVQRAIAKTAWVQSNNYYKADSGLVVTQWPYGVVVYSALIRLLRLPSSKVNHRRRSARRRRSAAAVPEAQAHATSTR